MEITENMEGSGVSPKREYLYYQKDVKKVTQKQKSFEFFLTEFYNCWMR
jgi:hypothetical protein